MGKHAAVVQADSQPGRLCRLARLTQVGIDFGQVGMPFGIGRIEVNGAQARPQGLLKLGLVKAGIPVKGHTKGGQRLGTIGSDPHRLPGFLDRLGRMSAQGQQVGPPDNRYRIRRLQRRCLAILVDRPIEIAVQVQLAGLNHHVVGPRRGGGGGANLDRVDQIPLPDKDVDTRSDEQQQEQDPKW
jgi:hypothetical protein